MHAKTMTILVSFFFSLVFVVTANADHGFAGLGHGNGFGNGFHGDEIVGGTPPGLRRSGHYPPGLSKHHKTPAGWSRGEKEGWERD